MKDFLKKQHILHVCFAYRYESALPACMVPAEARIGHQISQELELQIVLGCHLDSWCWTYVLCKDGMRAETLRQLSSLWLVYWEFCILYFNHIPFSPFFSQIHHHCVLTELTTLWFLLSNFSFQCLYILGCMTFQFTWSLFRSYTHKENRLSVCQKLSIVNNSLVMGGTLSPCPFFNSVSVDWACTERVHKNSGFFFSEIEKYRALNVRDKTLLWSPLYLPLHS